MVYPLAISPPKLYMPYPNALVVGRRAAVAREQRDDDHGYS
jgi:hypothetical protein